jgi:putative adenylate-forming enzyme
MTLGGATLALRAYAATLARAAWFRDRATLEAWQERRLQAWLRDRAGVARLEDLPPMDRAGLMANFAACNRLGLTVEAATAIAEGHSPRPRGYHVGLSTGTTSGRRMPYVISEEERFVWLGTILAKSLGTGALRRPRVAVALPRGSALYDAAEEGRALPLCFVSLAGGFATALARLTEFRPDVIVAPPRLLHWLALQRTPLSPRRIFAAAEMLDPPDRTAIATGFPGAVLGEIYMATEGLFAVTCRHGRLHLAEDVMRFDLEPTSDGTVEPVITDFTRRAQVMARYRTGDLLRVLPCSCGSPLRAVVVAGRASDRIGGYAPDTMRDAILASGVTDFRLVQQGDNTPLLTLPPETEATAPRVALEALLQRPIEVENRPLTLPEGAKLRRVMRTA